MARLNGKPLKLLCSSMLMTHLQDLYLTLQVDVYRPVVSLRRDVARTLRLCVPERVSDFGIILGNYTAKTKNFGTKIPVYFWNKLKGQKSCWRSKENPKMLSTVQNSENFGRNLRNIWQFWPLKWSKFDHWDHFIVRDLRQTSKISKITVDLWHIQSKGQKFRYIFDISDIFPLISVFR